MNIHTVRSGESLFTISRIYNVNPDDIANVNDLAPPYSLTEGQSLVILYPERVYVVESGDTIGNIALQAGISQKQLLRNNPAFIGRAYIEPGMRLILSFAEPKRRSITLSGYAYPSINASTLDYALKYLTYVTPFIYGMSSSGDLLPLNDEGILSAARLNNTGALMGITSLSEEGEFSSRRSDEVLGSRTARRRLIEQIADVTVEKNYDGVESDIEFIYPQNREAYASFIGEIAGELTPLGKITVADVAPKISATQSGLLYEGHDYRLLGLNADRIFLMTYEWGYTYGPPMAVAPLPNVRQVVSYAVSEIDPAKLWLGIPNYGYDWTLPYVSGESRARVVSNTGAVSLAARYGVPIEFNSYAMSPFFRYTDSAGAEHEVWFEDARSILAKLDLMEEFGLSGAGIWNIMFRFPALYTLVNALYDISDS